MTDLTKYAAVSLEDFVAQIPNGSHVVYVAQRGMGKTAVGCIVHMLQRARGDTANLMQYDCHGAIGAPMAVKLSPNCSKRTFIYGDKEMVCVRNQVASAGTKKRNYEVTPEQYHRNEFDIEHVVFLAPVCFPNAKPLMILKMLNKDPDYKEEWLLTAMELDSDTPYGPMVVKSAHLSIVPVVGWLHSFLTLPVNESRTPAVNPYHCDEQTFINLVTRDTYLLDLHKLTMASEMLEVRKGLEIAEYDGNDVVWSFFSEQEVFTNKQ
jgi:hypothetical protein